MIDRRLCQIMESRLQMIEEKIKRKSIEIFGREEIPNEACEIKTDEVTKLKDFYKNVKTEFDSLLQSFETVAGSPLRIGIVCYGMGFGLRSEAKSTMLATEIDNDLSNLQRLLDATKEKLTENAGREVERGFDQSVQQKGRGLTELPARGSSEHGRAEQNISWNGEPQSTRDML